MTDQDRKPSSELVESASAVGGALAGTAMTLVAGPFVGSASGELVARVLLRVGGELERRVLGPRHEQRVGEAFEVTAGDMRGKLEAGEAVRPDFFADSEDGGAAGELLEGTLRTAADAWEAQKVRYIAHVFSGTAFDSDLEIAEANYVLRLADRLTYRQFVALAVIGDYERNEPALTRAREAQIARERAPDAIVLSELDELESLGLIATRTDDGLARVFDGGTVGEPFIYHYEKAGLSDSGELLSRLLRLGEIPTQEQDDWITTIAGATTN